MLTQQPLSLGAVVDHGGEGYCRPPSHSYVDNFYNDNSTDKE